MLLDYLAPDVVPRGNKILKFHLLKFTGAEHKISGCDFVSERFADLTNPERYLPQR